MSDQTTDKPHNDQRKIITKTYIEECGTICYAHDVLETEKMLLERAEKTEKMLDDAITFLADYQNCHPSSDERPSCPEGVDCFDCWKAELAHRVKGDGE